MVAVLVPAAAAAVLACARPEDPRIEEGKRAFEQYRFHEAKAAFAAALADDPENADAAYAYARTTRTLNEYEEAIPAFERALALNARDPRVHEGYLGALTWGGVLYGRRAWLDRVLEFGPETLGQFPDLAPAYGSIEQAAGELNEQLLWLAMLEALEPDIGDSPVFQVQLLAARLASAKASGDAEAVAALESGLGDLLEATAAADAAATDGDAARRYQLAYGYKLLGNREAELQWLRLLEETADGRHLGARMSHFDIYMTETYATREEPLDTRLQLIDRWLERFPAQWDNPDFEMRRVAMSRHSNLLQEELRTSPSDELALTLVAVTEQLGMAETWQGAFPYVFAGRALLAADRLPDEALRLADLAIARIEEGQSGLFYPGTAPDELESVSASTRAALEQIRGQALARLGRTDEAEVALRAAVGQSPRADRYAALGEFLVGAERDQEGYEALVNALAWNVDEARIEREPEVREAALATLDRLGRPASQLEVDLAAAGEQVAIETRARIVGGRLDLPAPDFELTDTQGNEWRLSDLRGKVVVLNYWATWCGPCRTEFPHYEKLVADYADDEGVVFLAVSTDTDHAAMRGFLAENGYDFTVLLDKGSARDFQVVGIPTHLIIDPDGRIQYRPVGFDGEDSYARNMSWRIEELRRQ